jgi:hypothetical protein
MFVTFGGVDLYSTLLQDNPMWLVFPQSTGFGSAQSPRYSEHGGEVLVTMMRVLTELLVCYNEIGWYIYDRHPMLSVRIFQGNRTMTVMMPDAQDVTAQVSAAGAVVAAGGGANLLNQLQQLFATLQTGNSAAPTSSSDPPPHHSAPSAASSNSNDDDEQEYDEDEAYGDFFDEGTVTLDHLQHQVQAATAAAQTMPPISNSVMGAGINSPLQRIESLRAHRYLWRHRRCFSSRSSSRPTAGTATAAGGHTTAAASCRVTKPGHAAREFSGLDRLFVAYRTRRGEGPMAARSLSSARPSR